jgi:ketosteroid isomerase-like protein
MKTLPAAAALLLAACAHGPSGVDPHSLAAAESAFAAHSVREGMRAAFLASFADDGVMVRSGWVNSNAFLATRPDPPIVLDWRPAYVEVAASGELGLSTGPWKITSKAKPDAAPSYGQFVSVWRREGAGPWRVAVDLGIAHPQPALWDRALEAHVAGGTGGAGAIAAAERAFSERSASAGTRSAYESQGSERLRFYRGGAAPAIGKRAALEAALAADARLLWSVERIETSKSGDFGYARGSYAAQSAPGSVLGHYLRVWRLEAGAWRIALDVVDPLPGP